MQKMMKGRREYEKLLHLGESCHTVLDIVCASALAFCPILQYYIGPFQDAGITVLILILPWAAIRLVNLWSKKGISFRHTSILWGLLLFLVYRAFIHEISIKNIVFNIALFLLFLAAFYGCINVRQFLMTSSAIAGAACILVFVQTCSYYLLHRHLQLAPTSLFSDDADAWILLAKTGIIGVTQRAGNLYRPSAFFMEPSHLFLYTFPHLLLMLLSPGISRARLRLAVLYSVGLVLCTSGMGVVITGGAWALYISMSSGRRNRLKLRNILQPKNFIWVQIFLIFGFVVILAVPFVRESIKRFLDVSSGGAIAGRTRLSGLLLKSLAGKQLFFGVTNTIAGLNYNMSGFAATMYKFGLIGLVLGYWSYLFGVFRLKGAFFWISLTVVAVSFFSAQTHGTFYMIYYLFYIFEGWMQRTGGNGAAPSLRQN